MQKLYQLWYVDVSARRRFHVWTILIAFAYGLFNSLALRRAEQRVTWETLGLVCLLTVGFSLYYCIRPVSWKVPSSAYFDEIFRHRRLLVFGLVSTMVVLFLRYATETPTVQAAIINSEFKFASSSSSPPNFRTVNKITAAIRTASANDLPINPAFIDTVGKRFIAASGENPSFWQGALTILNYRSSLNKETPSYPSANCFSSPSSPRIAFHVIGSLLNNCNQPLDHIAWRDVVFENVTVIYHGGPTILENVQFKNCQFSLDDTLPGRQLAQSLMASGSVSVKLDGN